MNKDTILLLVKYLIILILLSSHDPKLFNLDVLCSTSNSIPGIAQQHSHDVSVP